MIKKILDKIEKDYPFEFEYWFSQVTLSLSADTLIIKSHNELVIKKFTEEINSILNQIFNEMNLSYNIKIIKTEKVDIESSEEINDRNENRFSSFNKKQKNSIKNDTKKLNKFNNTHQKIFDTQLNPKFTFDRFIPGSNSDLALKAAKMIANKDSESYDQYNPLFIYSPVGLGKTHLVQAIAHEIKSKYPEKKIVYNTCEKYLNHYTYAAIYKKFDQFREFYRDVDILIVDDIQFLYGKEKLQDEIFNNFNILHQKNKQIIFTSDQHPKELKNIEERLISRFVWGLTVDIKMPDFDTRKNLFLNKFKELSIDLNDDLIDFLSLNIVGNVRDIESVVNKILFIRELDIKLSKETLEQNLKDHFLTQVKREISVEKIKEIVAEYYHISRELLISQKKERKFVIPRQIGIYIAKELTTLSLSDIGKSFGNRSHTTVITASRKIEQERKQNISIKNDIEWLIIKIKDKRDNN